MEAAAQGGGKTTAGSVVSHIVLASRAYSRDEEKKMSQAFARLASGQTAKDDKVLSKYRVAESMVPFEGRDDVKRADKVVSEKLKEIFKPHLPKYEDDDELQDFAAADNHHDNKPHSGSDNFSQDGDDNIFKNQNIKRDQHNPV